MVVKVLEKTSFHHASLLLLDSKTLKRHLLGDILDVLLLVVDDPG